MVAKVISGKTIRGALSYNENKVAEGQAVCLMAHNFGSGPDQLSFHHKLDRFQNLMRWNRRTKTNTIHISLNFHNSDKLTTENLKAISSEYMEKIGFGEQPYLVYQHLDAGHPHVHLLTTNIQSNGKRIDIHNIGRNKSEKARTQIERKFKLVAAKGRKEESTEIKPAEIKAATYGKSETKRAVSNVVRHVIKAYRYTSLPEFNAALRQFNIVADRGREGMRMFEKKGLLYSILDGSGNKVGVPIKASAIYGKPLLSQIEKQFKLNEALRSKHKERLKSEIDRVFSKKLTTSEFHERLKNVGVYALFRFTPSGEAFGVTFVDNVTKVVFKGSDLGKEFSAKAICERLSGLKYPKASSARPRSTSSPKSVELNFGMTEILTELSRSGPTDFTSPETALKLRRRKKKRGRKY